MTGPSTELKNLFERPVSEQSAVTLVRIPLARNAYFGTEHLVRPILNRVSSNNVLGNDS